MAISPFLEPKFIEEKRREIMADGLMQSDADRHISNFISRELGNESDFSIDYNSIQETPEAVSGLLDFYAYGTTQPTERFEFNDIPTEDGGSISSDILGGLQKGFESAVPGISPDLNGSGGDGGLGILEKPLEAVEGVLGAGADRAVESIRAGFSGEQGPVETATQVGLGALGTAARLVDLPIGAALSGASKLIPQSAKDKFANDPLVQKLGQDLSEAMEGLERIKKEDPALGRNLQSALDAGTAALTAFGLKEVVRGTKVATTAVKQARTTKAIGSIDDFIDEGISKGVKPTVRGKKTIARSNKFKADSREAVKSIVKRKGTLKLTTETGEEVIGETPENLLQFSQSIGQSKKAVFKEWRSQLDDAAQSGLKIDMEDMAQSLDDLASKKKFVVGRPKAAEHAKKLADRIRKSGPLAPDELDDLIQEWNNSLASFYAGAGDKAVGEIEGSVAKLARAKLDDFVETTTGKSGFQGLKNEYGALRSLEEEVSKRAIVEARRSAKGFFDLTDVFTGGELVSGLLTGNASQIIKGSAGRSIKEYIKFINNPNRIVKKMFQQVDNAIQLQ